MKPVSLNGVNPVKAQNPELLDCKHVAALCGCSPRMIWRLRDMGDMPAPIRLGGLVRWRRADIDAWIAGGCKPVRTMGRVR